MNVSSYFAAILLIAPLWVGYAEAEDDLRRIGLPEQGKLYHGVFPGSPKPDSGEANITECALKSYQQEAGKKVAWVYFSNDWFLSRAFPMDRANWIRNLGSVPYIRLMLRSSDDSIDECEILTDEEYSLKAIIAGDFDEPLRKWAREAVAYADPLIVEYGTECNGYWFPWNGKHNGGDTKDGFYDPALEDGPERFVHAYRHIIKLMRDEEGATNITWVWHVNFVDNPEVKWNRIQNYYPDNRERYPDSGPPYIDWLAVSCYGAIEPLQTWAPSPFIDVMDDIYRRLKCMDASKPVIVAEFGTTSGYAEQNPTAPNINQFRPGPWATSALEGLLHQKHWPKVIGFSWWNEHFTNKGGPLNDTNMRLESNSGLSKAVRETLEKHKAAVETRPQVKKID